ncbi:hypothetical protein MVES1_001212 [Malassezia vespertilionis]|uniref:EF-hand domain-containing protein n=1 Tax=Malassezia vespertilionis TaxID=2020962 RepID=A0A2N1JDT4_9BASI|nr:uncharacterized protein MVES1_001212 [Malassezia vespertilionis]PKI84696.1 hypothetical protein MVES_001142 [Malassezia vespertilionis]WFD05878.1 hypothetical protein MVES1_001212 [Malassezia vespertilionis]
MDSSPSSAGTEEAGRADVEGKQRTTEPVGTKKKAAHLETSIGRHSLSFENIRGQEPPQARLLRLRGLFDLLMDHDSDSALAGGRAKQVWRHTASRARYGAGGCLATGSLSSRPGTVQVAVDSGEQRDTSESKSPSAYLREWFFNVRRQSYANELLGQCRECRAGLERARKELSEAHDNEQASRKSWLTRQKQAHNTSDATAATRAWQSLLYFTHDGEGTSLLSRFFGTKSAPLMMRLESGWKGSRVWGLSATEEENKHDVPRHDTQSASQTDETQYKAKRMRQRQLEWEGFLAYAEFQERELYKLFTELDTNRDGVLDISEIRSGFARAGAHPSELVMDDFIACLASSGVSDVKEQHNAPHYVTFPEFRDYLLLMPHKPSIPEIFRFYQVRKAVGLFGNEGIFAELGTGWGKTARGASALTFDSDVSLSGEEHLHSHAKDSHGNTVEPRMGESTGTRASKVAQHALQNGADDGDADEQDESSAFHGHHALKFLLAGGIAGAVSRTATAPLDRLKVYLITSQKPRGNGSTRLGMSSMYDIMYAMRVICRDGGLRSFWLGNGLNCIKIFPESAIKFFSYEMSKRWFAKHYDHVADSRDISGFSRFMSGGIGGITSQLSIYPIETLKTRLMSSESRSSNLHGMALLKGTAKQMYAKGGIRAYYRGLAAGLFGVFPYSAIDMSTFEGIKLFYLKYTHKEEPGVFAMLAFGSLSGSIGATTVYPLNLIRTRLQASGTPAHPVFFMDAAIQTYKREGAAGFYRGLVPSLAKVAPAVSISYVVYEESKRHLGVS